ncbi:SLBB domain-containing protein [Ferrimonas lipolytica]|uniref:Sugar transporter n=1 Tax=Ferrimonas lipolytica TaxID=2724191 RepID=A0A6H1UE09_9GAMM|nr:SLBB domain-containing protein [Ferrimonas lipolytica]QIZ77325.1 sugar transporter [Ferrimonas lipolytica]
MKHTLRKWLTVMVATLPLLMTVSVDAMSISPEMIEQFKKLPPTEQKRLAQQYGIDPAMLSGASGASSSQSDYSDQPLMDEREQSNQRFQEDEGEELEAEDEQELKPYGYELFAGQPTTFAPATDIPIPSDYVLGPGDQLQLQLFGKSVSNETLTIARNGSVVIAELGPIHLAGMTFADARQAIAATIKAQMIGVNGNLTMGELRSIRVFIAGEAFQPGSYTLSALSTVSHAVTLAGGLSEIGSLRNIQVKRSGKVVGHFDAYDLLMHGDASGDVRLQSGDVVFIPPVAATVSVDGEVRRPAIYELSGNETMADIVSMAGGLMAGAYPSASNVERFNNRHQRSIVNVDLTSANGKAMDVNDGDYLTVRSTSEEIDGAITIVGSVTRPGSYQWQPGMTVSNLLPSPEADLTWNTDLSYALLVREINVRGDIEVFGFDLELALRTPKGEQDLVLQPSDKLIIFSLRNEVLDRRALGEFANKLAKEEGLQDAELTDEEALDAGLNKLDNKSTLSNRKSIAGVAVSHQDELDEQAQKKAELRSMVLLQLFQHRELIELSPQLQREELLYPVLAKLNDQARLNSKLQAVSVAGEVAHPGAYPLVVNGTVKDLIAMAGGLKESAFSQNAEITRTIRNQNQAQMVEHISVDLTEQLANNGAILLQSRDRLNVLTTPAWQETAMVELHGEVRFPGKYAIQKGETLADVIKRAGGFTEYAYTYGGVFTRESVRAQEQLEIQRAVTSLRKEMANRTLSEQGTFATVEDTETVLYQLESVEATGRMVIDFEEVVNNNPRHNLMAEDGDVVYIPTQKQTVAVMGEVQHPSSHRFNETISLEGYLKLAGGATRRADDSRVYVVRADGSVMLPEQNFWFGSSAQQLRPGDTVIMPLETNYRDGMTYWGDITQIIYNSAIAIAAIGGI